MTFEAYMQKALVDELKFGDAYSDTSPRLTLTGKVENLNFSSSRGLTGGTWDSALQLQSSNGKSMRAVEHYEFESGFVADTACKQTAQAFTPTVQNLIGKDCNGGGVQGAHPVGARSPFGPAIAGPVAYASA